MIISIITINYENVKGLKNTLDSIASQTYKDYELVVVDGGSSDGSKELIEQRSKEFLNISWISEPDKGIYNAMNKGVRMANGKYCIFMNSGDCFYNYDSLKDSIIYLEDDIDIISGAMKCDEFSKVAPKDSELSLSFFVKDSLNHQSTYIKRELLLNTPYNENRKIVGDLEFFFNVLILQGCSYKSISLTVSYCESGGISYDIKKSKLEKEKAIKELLPIRMSSDVDFISKYHNPIVMRIGNLLYKDVLRKLYFNIKRIKNKLKK